MLHKHQPWVSWKYGTSVFLREGSLKVALSGISPRSSWTTMANFCACRKEMPTGYEFSIILYFI